MYNDVILKNKYYTEQALKLLRKENLNVNIDDAENIAKLINNYISIFRYDPVQNNNYFNCEKLNKDTEKILADLNIIYKVLKTAEDDFINIKSYIDCHIEELENYVDKYKNRTELELNTTSLGETLYYQDSDFYFIDDGTSSYLSLGTISIPNASTLACYYDSDTPDVSFIFYQDNNIVYETEDYNINKEIVKTYGNIKKNYYSVNLDEDLIINNSFSVMPEDLELVNNNKYFIYAGKNKLTTISNSVKDIIDKNFTVSVNFNQETKVEFYIVGGNTAQLDFTKEPKSKNFNDYIFELDSSGYIKVSFTVYADTAFNIITDGIIYAERKDPSIVNNILFYPEKSELKDFLIEEYVKNNTQDYLVNIKILNNLTPVNPKYIAIKLLDTFGAD